jgi:hypothetical protein
MLVGEWTITNESKARVSVCKTDTLWKSSSLDRAPKKSVVKCRWACIGEYRGRNCQWRSDGIRWAVYLPLARKRVDSRCFETKLQIVQCRPDNA